MRLATTMAYLFGIRPWEWPLLTIAETEAFHAEADAWLKHKPKGGLS